MANNDRLVELAGRGGLVSRAAIWLVTGLLAARLAFDGRPEPGAEPDKNGALQTLARQPFGRALLLVLIVGFAAMIAWSVAEMVRKRDGERSGHWGHRVVAAGRGLIYIGLTFTTLQLLAGDDTSGQGSQEQLTARVLGWPGGRLIIGGVALALLAAAAFNIYRAVSRRYEKHWDRKRMDGRARRIAGPVEAIGNFGHALVFGLVGWFLAMAALHFDPTEPKSLDESLLALVQEPLGRALCFVVAAGMAAWALNALAQSRWREIPARD
ncbi:MAG: DUF1206 domain-containing protein [Acidimicrobiales bacterium]|nr:DUF1206 domain-containing protein [Acidimicrobiales bacterium]